MQEHTGTHCYALKQSSSCCNWLAWQGPWLDGSSGFIYCCNECPHSLVLHLQCAGTTACQFALRQCFMQETTRRGTPLCMLYSADKRCCLYKHLWRGHRYVLRRIQEGVVPLIPVEEVARALSIDHLPILIIIIAICIVCMAQRRHHQLSVEPVTCPAKAAFYKNELCGSGVWYMEQAGATHG